MCISTTRTLSFGEMIGGGFNLGRFFVVELAATASVHLDLEVSFGADARFPRLLAEFDLTLELGPGCSCTGSENSDGSIDFGFKNLRLDSAPSSASSWDRS